MINRILYIASIFLIAVSLKSQPKEIHYNNWLFGTNAAITFNTNDGNPLPLDLPTAYNSREGMACISDDNGDLLYYINPSAILNSRIISKDNATLVNGNGIFTNGDVASGGLFVKSIADTNIFYLITLDNPRKNSFDQEYNRGVNYSVIDKSKGNGGEVIKKNINLYPNATEKIVGVMNEVDNICWVITHEYNNNAFKIIKIDENGLDENLKTVNIGMSHSSKKMGVISGRITASPNGTTLAMPLTHYDTGPNPLIGDVELYDFDPMTGDITNPRSLQLNHDAYTLAFSPNGQVLYVKQNDKIIQYDLSYCDIEETIENKYIIDTKESWFYNSMERGPNGVIYCGIEGNEYLDGIMNPNVIGPGCNYTENVVEIGGTFRLGLPTVISSYFTGEYDKCSPVNEAEYKIDVPKYVCLGDEFEIKIKSNYDESYTARIDRLHPNPATIASLQSKDSVVSVYLTEELKDDIMRLVYYKVYIEGRNNELDTLDITVNSRICCGDAVINGNFSSVSTGGRCAPIGYETDLDFRSSTSSNCPYEFTERGQIASSSSAKWHNENFSREPKVGSNFLVGDPNPNKKERAWYQNVPTIVGRKYKFTAYVTNVEKTIREKQFDQQLNMYLSVKNRYSQLELSWVSNIKYEDGWVELTGEFTATDNTTELSVGVNGECHSKLDDCYSNGFGIDDISLMPINEYDFDLAKDTTICLDEPLQISNSFSEDIVSVEWSPTEGVSDPNILNPVVSPTENTTYTIKFTDKYYCQYDESLEISVDSCLVQCAPCVSVFLDDEKVSIGDDYCVSGELIPLCEEGDYIGELSLYFEYNPDLMDVISASTDYQLLQRNEKNIIKLNFEDKVLNKNERNDFSVCFTALLGDTNATELLVYSDEEINIDLCLEDTSIAVINYDACIFSLRKVEFFNGSYFEAIVETNRISVQLTTDETGTFRFVLTDMAGKVIKDEIYITTKNKYEKEEVIHFDLDHISSGAYILKMQSPIGTITTQKVLITK